MSYYVIEIRINKELEKSVDLIWTSMKRKIEKINKEMRYEHYSEDINDYQFIKRSRKSNGEEVFFFRDKKNNREFEFNITIID